MQVLMYQLLSMQMILILTKSLNKCFEKNPKFDMTPLLGGTDVVFSSLIHSFSWFVSMLSLLSLCCTRACVSVCMLIFIVVPFSFCDVLILLIEISYTSSTVVREDTH